MEVVIGNPEEEIRAVSDNVALNIFISETGSPMYVHTDYSTEFSW